MIINPQKKRERKEKEKEREEEEEGEEEEEEEERKGEKKITAAEWPIPFIMRVPEICHNFTLPSVPPDTKKLVCKFGTCH